MIWRCKDHTTGLFKSVVGEEWVYGCCPLCKKENNYYIPLKGVGSIKNQRTMDVFIVFRCSYCDTCFIWNHVTYQISEACKQHWYPVMIQKCRKCVDELVAEMHEARHVEYEEDTRMMFEC